jgi:hypothetical protein
MNEIISMKTSDLYSIILDAHDKGLIVFAEFIANKMQDDKFDDEHISKMSELLEGDSFKNIMNVAEKAWKIKLMKSVQDIKGLRKYIENLGPDYMSDLQGKIDKMIDANVSDGELLN